ncbi:unnamed protein product [Linum trigynum]|uniref:Uncharacterized protein n=1 Tax=Linum trigynum TaxID=586398 RepID=A0AAV2CFW3_9ROSI
MGRNRGIFNRRRRRLYGKIDGGAFDWVDLLEETKVKGVFGESDWGEEIRGNRHSRSLLPLLNAWVSIPQLRRRRERREREGGGGGGIERLGREYRR